MSKNKSLTNGWDCEQKCEILQQEMLKVLDALDEINDIVHKACETFYKAKMQIREMKNIIQEHDYHE